MSQENLESVSQLRKHKGSHPMFDLFLIRRSVFLLLQLGFSKDQEVKGAVEYDKRWVHGILEA